MVIASLSLVLLALSIVCFFLPWVNGETSFTGFGGADLSVRLFRRGGRGVLRLSERGGGRTRLFPRTRRCPTSAARSVPTCCCTARRCTPPPFCSACRWRRASRGRVRIASWHRFFAWLAFAVVGAPVRHDQLGEAALRASPSGSSRAASPTSCAACCSSFTAASGSIGAACTTDRKGARLRALPAPSVGAGSLFRISVSLPARDAKVARRSFVCPANGRRSSDIKKKARPFAKTGASFAKKRGGGA